MIGVSMNNMFFLQHDIILSKLRFTIKSDGSKSYTETEYIGDTPYIQWVYNQKHEELPLFTVPPVLVVGCLVTIGDYTFVVLDIDRVTYYEYGETVLTLERIAPPM